ncbi:MAG: PspC domain-containing protein [Nitriliruptorales bacterium]|nr:PspC domain-containing protein [Nitriliruptorales bacterium]
MSRNSDAGWVAGVCAGMTPDSTLATMLLRAAFVFVPGAFVLYFVLWAVLPDES